MKKKSFGLIAAAVMGMSIVAAKKMEKEAKKNCYSASLMDPISQREKGFYESYIKRYLDIVCASGAIIFFSPLYLSTAALVKMKLGSPVIFTQDRPGMIGEDGRETIFKMYKFRTMTDERDEKGELLPDELRLTKFGAWLRTMSLDEIPEAFNILNGTMSVIGPRPQLIKDMAFMSSEQRVRHTAKPGLSGLAQVNGRNAIKWEDKINWDLEYVNNINFINDLRIVLSTAKKVFLSTKDKEYYREIDIAADYGDDLLSRGLIKKTEYDLKQKGRHR